MRTCKHCGNPRPDDHFPKGRAKCNACLASYKRDLRNGTHHPIEKPAIRTCRVCNKTEQEIEFARRDNICKADNTDYMRQYRKKNRKKLNQQILGWKHDNHEHYRESERKHYHTPEGKAKHVARVTKTPRTKLSHLLGRVGSSSRNPGPHDPKGDDPRREYNLDLDYLCELWKQQDGLCALSRIPMVHKYSRLDGVSIDRIDPSKGHLKGNIQLVCQFVNYAKRHYGNDIMLELLAKVVKHFDVGLSQFRPLIQPDISTSRYCPR